jgi:membrane protein YdbS with pleckstrin-like domain
MPHALMSKLKENITIILLILLGAIIVPVLFIWTADNLLALTLKTFVAVFFLLLLIRAIPWKKDKPHQRQSVDKDEG